MKWFKSIAIGVILACMLFFAFYRKEEINLEADWYAKKIVLDGKQLFPTEIDSYIKVGSLVKISGWENSMAILADRTDLTANYKIKDKICHDYIVHLTSDEKALNGDFTMKIDTVHVGPKSYTVHIELESGKTLLYFERFVNIGPWKPPFPRRGAV